MQLQTGHMEQLHILGMLLMQQPRYMLLVTPKMDKTENIIMTVKQHLNNDKDDKTIYLIRYSDF